MFKKIIILLTFLFISTFVKAQTPCTDPTNAPGVPCPPGRSIDGGIAILVALGAAYGIKKIKKED